MNPYTVIAGAVLLAVCILPLFIIIRSRKKVENQMSKSLEKIANASNCQLSFKDLSGNFAIGIDDNKKFVFFFKNSKVAVIEESIELAKYKSCKVIKSSKTIKSGNGTYNEIEKLELNFIPKIKDNEEINLEFFNAEGSFQLNGELQVIEKWSNLINKRLQV